MSLKAGLRSPLPQQHLAEREMSQSKMGWVILNQLWCQSPSRREEGRGDEEGGMWRSPEEGGGGEFGHPHCPGTLIRRQSHGARTDVCSHTRVIAITLQSVVNKWVRCEDFQIRAAASILHEDASGLGCVWSENRQTDADTNDCLRYVRDIQSQEFRAMSRTTRIHKNLNDSSGLCWVLPNWTVVQMAQTFLSEVTMNKSSVDGTTCYFCFSLTWR